MDHLDGGRGEEEEVNNGQMEDHRHVMLSLARPLSIKGHQHEASAEEIEYSSHSWS